jgi:hypothetical protein
MRDNGAMFLLVLVGILLLVLFWRYILVRLCLLVLVHIMGTVIHTTTADMQPNYRRKTTPFPAQTVAKPARALPARGYLPRWNTDRRLDAGRELAQWQKQFDNGAL